MGVNKQIFITSINKAVNKAKSTGKLDLKTLSLYNLYKYYIDFTQDIPLFKEKNKCLKEAISDFKYKYPLEVCNYKNVIPTNGYTIPVNEAAPTVSGSTIALLEEESIFFTVEDFTTSFSDSDNNNPGRIILYLTGLDGTFKYNGTVVTSTLQIDVDELVNIEYIREDSSAFSFSLPYRISDDGLPRLWSTIVNNTVSGTIAGNQPATVGDNTVYVGNRSTTILTLAMFTSQLTPPYNDPESDLIDAIRLDEVSTANLGKFYLNGIEVIEGQIITREDINNNLFTHEGPNQNTLASDNFSFSARDEGSLIWVS